VLDAAFIAVIPKCESKIVYDVQTVVYFRNSTLWGKCTYRSKR